MATYTEPFSDEHLRFVERITVNFSALEFFMKMCVAFTFGSMRNYALTIAAGLDFRKLADVFT